jgi:integrase/recombinase XerD
LQPLIPKARVAELVDALDSKSSSGNGVRVRFPPRVQHWIKTVKKQKPKDLVKQVFRLFLYYYFSLELPLFCYLVLLFCYSFGLCTCFVTIFDNNNKPTENKMVAKDGKKKQSRGTKKNNVTLRKKLLANDNISYYLDIYRDGKRSYEFLKLYINSKARTPLERESNRQNRELAEKIRTQRESELNHSAFGEIAPENKKILFIDYSQSYTNNYTKKDIRMITGAIQRFKDYYAEKYPKIKISALKLSEIDKQMIIGYVEYLESHSKGEGAQSYFKRFKKVLTNAVDTGLITKNPANGVKCETVEGLRKDILSNEEIVLLAKTPCQNQNIKRAFILSCSTGLRFCDVKELKYSDIDFSNDKMTIDQQKTGKPVIIDLNNTAKKLIGEPGEPKTLVFELPTSEGSNKTLGAWVKRTGIEKHITWHCARHSFAVNLLTSPQRPDIKTVSSTLGHTSLKHTEKYTRVVDELKKKAVNALPDYEF